MSPQQRAAEVERALATQTTTLTAALTKAMNAPHSPVTTGSCTCDTCTKGGKK